MFRLIMHVRGTPTNLEALSVTVQHTVIHMHMGIRTSEGLAGQPLSNVLLQVLL
jgi:hypothetical protein